MPSICGIFQRQHQHPVDPTILAQASRVLPACGMPVNTFINASTGCAGTLSARHGITLVADIRLDNRLELGERLALSSPTDPEILLAAYLKWGRNCLEHLVGDFAFGLWDEPKQRWFCGRDPFGVRPFYYSLQDAFFAFASEIKGVLCFPKVSGRLNEARIGDYLSLVVADTHSTFYADILRLPPGTSLTVTPDAHSVQTYYTFESAPILYNSDEEYADHFHAIFKEAVVSRIRNPHSGFLLSGGLDSSSIACMADRLNQQEGRGAIAVYSGIFDTIAECDERPYIDAVLGQGNFHWQGLRADELDLFGVLPEMAQCQDEPWFAPHMFMMWNILAQMQRDGKQVVLDGHDGDTTVSHGWNYINNLIDEYDVRGLWQQARGLSRVHGRRCYKDIASNVVRRKLGFVVPLVRFLKGRSPSPMVADLNLLAPGFRRECQVDERVKTFIDRYQRLHLREELDHRQAVFQPLQPFALEVLGRTARHFGMEYHCPFWDKRLVEFCLNIPPAQKLQDGLSRSILRRAMAPVLPGKVQQRPGKIDFTPNLSHSFAKRNGENVQLMLSQALPLVEKWVDKDLISNYSYASNEKSGVPILSIWKVVTLAAWIQARESGSP